MSDRPDSVARVEADAKARGVEIRIVETDGSARTAAEAAAAVGTSVGRIVKSLVFRGENSGKAYLLLVSGSNRVDEAAMAAHLGETLARADAAFVREATGFAIGGVSPFGGSRPLATVMDEALLGFASVWAAAGTPRHVFEVAPERLRDATGAIVANFA